MTEVWLNPEAIRKVPGRVAVLVDGENVSQDLADTILTGAGRGGTVTVRRVYGDMAILRDWEADVRFHAKHTGHGRSKNTADINLVIDAMDLAHSELVDAFVLVSSDGDFAPLATRLREAGFHVTGIGRPNAAQSFKEACSHFHQILSDDAPAARPATIAAVSAPPKPPRGMDLLSDLDAAIHRVCRTHGGKTARITLVELGSKMPLEQGIPRKVTGKATWRSYLTGKGDLYILEGNGAKGCVRLKTP